MTIEKDDLLLFENLSKLRLSEDEREKASEYFNFLDLEFNKLSMVDSANTAPMPSPLEITNVFREDIAKKDIPRKEILKNAPEQSDGYFVVPKTVE